MAGVSGSAAWRRGVVAGLAVALTGGVLAVSPVAAQQAGTATSPGVVEVEVLSGRGDLVTGGDALLEVSVPAGVSPAVAKVDVDGRDVTAAFRQQGSTLRGLVTGLALGQNTVRAVLPDGRGARLVVKNAPLGGPVFSGPQIQPWTCAGEVRDAQCSRDATVTFLYKSTSGGALRAYDPANPPSDVATTTTDEGTAVPFIVREETGNSLRDQYKIAALFDPAKPVDPTAENPGFADKLVLTHGASCDTSYEMGTAPSVLLEDALGQGFAVASHALDNAGHNCNIVTQAESLIVTKELVVERFGPLDYTIGTGCSGGSLVLQQVSNAYPGVYQGILPQCTFTDAWSSAQQYVDYVGLREYLEGPGSAQTGILPAQWPSIFGHANPANQITFTEVIPNSGDPSRSCPGVPAEQVYSDTNRTGVRCSFQDYMKNVFGIYESGPDAGKARRPISNVGVQYGLSGFLASLSPNPDPTRPPLTADQFTRLNAGAGGYDIDFNRTAERTVADPVAMDRVYRSGAVNTGAHLDDVAIIDLGGPEPGAFHDVYRKFAMRDRLVREHGDADNWVLWEGQTPLLGDPSFVTAGIRKMDEWLAAIDADTRAVPLSQKVVDAKARAAVVQRCVAANGAEAPLALCRGTVDATLFSSPRIEAGGGDQALVNGVGPAKVSFTDDRLDCELMPLETYSYAGRSFTQVFTPAQQELMKRAFPTGVCDYSKPGKGFQAATTWMTYQDDAGKVVYGGTPMGPAPRSVPFGPGTLPCAGAGPSAVTDRAQARAEHRASVDCVLFLQIARGTTATTYSPLAPVTRGQMASFLVGSLEAAGVKVPAGKAGAFGDIATSTHRANIERLAAAGIAEGSSGADGGSYRPSATVTRAQMASFVVRTAEFAEGARIGVSRTDHFGDVAAGSVHERAIATGFEAGLFSGTVAPRPGAPRSGQFSPAATVVRDQMASFLVGLHTRLTR